MTRTTTALPRDFSASALLCSLLALLALVAGCGIGGSTPTGRWIAARETLTAAQDAVVSLHEAGVVDDLGLVDAHAVALSVREALNVAEASLPDGGDQFELWMTAAAAGLSRLRETVGARPKEVPDGP